LKALLGSAFFCLLCMGVAVAADLTPFRDGARIGAHVRNLKLPPALRRELRSGLTHRVLVRVELTADSRVLESRSAEVAVKYDLWDENFRLTVMSGTEVIANSVLTSEDQVLAFLDDVRLPQLFDIARLQASREHALKGEVLVNPVEQERLEMIRKWVAENSTPRGADSGAHTGQAPVGAAVSGDLFNRIFDSYASGAAGAAALHESMQSRPFRPESLPNEGP
jgi:hypothetical protein